MKKILLFCIALLVCWAESIEDFQVSMKIYPDGTLHIREDILYDFGTHYRHGIYRDIPDTIQTDFLPKKIGLGDFRVSLDGKEVPFETIYGQRAIRIKIGDPHVRITGKHHYTIGYSVEKGVLYQDRTHDAVRWNAIGTDWRVPIGNVRVLVHLPSILSKENVQIHTFTGRYGSQKSQASLQWLSGHDFIVHAKGFAPHEGLTVEVAFQRGLLGQSGAANQHMGFLDYVQAFIQYPLLLLLLFFLFTFYKEHVTPLSFSIHPVYKPPKDMDILEAGLLYDRFADTKDFPAAVVELAVRGLVRIQERAGEGFFGKKETVIQKTAKEPKDLTPTQSQLYFHILFPYEDTFILQKDETIAKRIRDGFQKINQLLYDWSVKEGYFQENPKKLRIKFLALSSFMMFVMFLLIAIVSHRYFDLALSISIVMMGVFIGFGVWKLFKGRGLERFLGLWFIFIAGSILIGFLSSFSWRELLLAPIPFLFLGMGAIVYIYYHIGLYTPKGKRVYKELQGLKEFIQRAEAAKINYFLQEDPSYLDKLLPYAMLFGLTKHWLKLYGDLHTSAPSWYQGDFDRFGDFGESASAIASYTPSGSVGGGGSFGGGGAGGGGGGSW